MAKFPWLSLLLIVALLAACQPSTPTMQPTAVAETVTRTPRPTATAIIRSNIDVDEKDLDGVELAIWHAWFGAPAALFDLQIAQFNEENPWGITVSATYQGSYSTLFDAVIEGIDGGSLPDLAVALPEEISVWNQTDSVKDLTPYILDPIWGFTIAEQTDFPRAFLRQDQRPDRWLALPAQRTARFLLYNKTWAEELGFDTPPEDFDEFREQSCAANKAMLADENVENDGKGGWIVDHHPASTLAWMYAFGGGPLTDDAYKFVADENIVAFKSLKRLYDDGCAWGSTADTPYEQFANRSALFIAASMEEFSDISRTFNRVDSRDEWQALPFPGAEGQAIVPYGSSYAILATDDVEALASWLFVKWMLESPQQAKWVKSTALFPLRSALLEELSDFERSNPQWAQAVELIDYAETQPQLPSWRQVRYMLGDGLEYIYRFNTQAGSVAAILAHMDQASRALDEK